jgi:UDP-N-acetylmuramoyl-tripeptide--D-alanyl-D-alanine ligase
VIDDAYNSNPAALTAMLRSLGAMAADRRVAVIGEMLELGELAGPLHQACGRAAAASRLSRLYTIGGEPARLLGDAAVDAGMPRAAVVHFDSSGEAAPVVASAVTAGDVVLVKGSRGTRTDVVVERLTAVFG